MISSMFVRASAVCLLAVSLQSCDFIKMKTDKKDASERTAVARVNQTYLYKDEVAGIATNKVKGEDSVARISAYIDSWIRKQLIISEALKNIDIDEAEMERKILDYRYSLIAYQYQNYYLKKNMVDSVTDTEIQTYYQSHQDNFILKQNIIQGIYIKVPKGAPRLARLKELIYANKPKELNELKSYCLSFSSVYHLADSSWIEFDKLVVNSPLAEIPNKIQFLKNYAYYETADAEAMYFLKIDGYKISDNISPLEFVKDDIKNIILNKRKVELAHKLEEQVYEKAIKDKEFEIFSN
jgi:hypothetical protein